MKPTENKLLLWMANDLDRLVVAWHWLADRRWTDLAVFCVLVVAAIPDGAWESRLACLGAACIVLVTAQAREGSRAWCAGFVDRALEEDGWKAVRATFRRSAGLDLGPLGPLGTDEGAPLGEPPGEEGEPGMELEATREALRRSAAPMEGGRLVVTINPAHELELGTAFGHAHDYTDLGCNSRLLPGQVLSGDALAGQLELDLLDRAER